MTAWKWACCETFSKAYFTDFMPPGGDKVATFACEYHRPFFPLLIFLFLIPKYSCNNNNHNHNNKFVVEYLNQQNTDSLVSIFNISINSFFRSDGV